MLRRVVVEVGFELKLRRVDRRGRVGRARVHDHVVVVHVRRDECEAG